MHNESLIVTAVLVAVGLFLVSRKNTAAHAAGIVVCALAGLMFVAGVTA